MTDFSPLSQRSPSTPGEWERYYELRWKVLREPWGQPRGSERDDLDSRSFHAALWDGDDAIAAGRLHLNSPAEAQVRYMAVDPSRQGQGLGSRILGILEARAVEIGATSIVLNAREEAAGFYRRHAYEKIGSAGLLFGSILHLRMRKQIG